MSDLKLLLIGASVFQRNSQGKLTSKQLVVDYVHGFRQYFRQVIWATTLFEGEAYTQTVVDEGKVIPCILHGRPKGVLSDYLKLRHLIDSDSIIFLHLPNPWLIPFILILRRKAKALFVYVAGDYVMHSEISKRTRGIIYSKLYRFIYESPVRFADGVIVRGEKNLKRARMLNHNVTKTVPIGLTTVLYQRKKEPLSGRSVRLLYVGKLVEGKGVEILLKAFAGLVKRLPDKDISLSIVGTGLEEENLKALCSSTGVLERVRFMGFIDDKYELSKLYAESDILVVPSTYPEGVPRVIDEALLHGTIVVASALPSLCEEFSNEELLFVPPGDVIALENLLFGLISKGLSSELQKKLDGRISSRSYSASVQHASFILETIGNENEKESRLRQFYNDPSYIKRVQASSNLRRISSPYIIDLLREKLVLELGCGAAPNDHLGKGYIGLDISEDALKEGRGRGVRICGTMENIPLRERTLGAVITVAVLEHSTSPDRVLKEIVRVLQPADIVVHQDAWNVPRWRSLGLRSKSYSQLSVWHKLLKTLLPVLDSLPARALRILPGRIKREIMFRLGEKTLDFKHLNPNYTLPDVSDADARSSIDSHAVVLFYKSLGLRLMKPKDNFVSRIFHHGLVIVKKD